VPRDSPEAAAKAVHAALDRIAVDEGSPWPPPVAIGALPSDLSRTGTLVVPEALVGRDGDGGRWVTTVLPVDAGDDDHDALVESVLSLRERSDDVAVPPQGYDVRAERPPRAWQDAVVA